MYFQNNNKKYSKYNLKTILNSSNKKYQDRNNIPSYV